MHDTSPSPVSRPGRTKRQGGNGREVWARLGVPPGDRTVSRARPFLQHSSELGLLTEPLEGVFGRPSPWHPSGERIHPLCRNRRFVYHNIYRVAKRNRPLFWNSEQTSYPPEEDQDSGKDPVEGVRRVLPAGQGEVSGANPAPAGCHLTKGTPSSGILPLSEPIRREVSHTRVPLALL